MMDEGFAVRGLSDAFSDAANSPVAPSSAVLESPKGQPLIPNEEAALVESSAAPTVLVTSGDQVPCGPCDATLHADVVPSCSGKPVGDLELSAGRQAHAELVASPAVISSPPIKTSGFQNAVLGADEDLSGACPFPSAVTTAAPEVAAAATEAALVSEEAPAATPALVAKQDTIPPAGPVLGEGFAPSVALNADEHVEVQDFSAEPIEERFRSKDINRRCSAYAEAQEKMNASDEAVFVIFKAQIGACVGETLPKAQDAALGALAAYLSKCPVAAEEKSAVLQLVRQLVEHKSIDKPKFQQSVSLVVMCVAEICECPPVLKEMTDCLESLESAGKKKSVGLVKKSIAFIIRQISQILAEFGPQKLPPKLGYVPICLKHVMDSDRGLKDACYSVLVELSCWIGDVADLIKAAEKPQRDEVAKRIEALPEESRARGEPKRIYRGETRPEPGSSGPGAGKKDQFDLMEEVDALKTLPKDWAITKVFTLEAWKEKQALLAVLSSALDVKRLANSDGYSDIVHPLIRILKTESNIPILQEAAKCVSLMAKGLRKEFDRYARQCLTVALGRMQDKSVWKPHVLVGMTEQLLWSLPFEFFMEEVRPYAKNKSNFVKSQAILLLIRSLDLPSVHVACADAAQRFLGPLADIVLPLIEDSDNSVRQEAVRCLVDLASRNLESPQIGPLMLEKIPNQRRKGFDDEWRKTKKDLPLPSTGPCTSGSLAEDGQLEAPSKTTLATPRTRVATKVGSRNASPKSRQASPLKQQPEESSISKMPSPRVAVASTSNSGSSVSGKACQGADATGTERAIKAESRCRELEAELEVFRRASSHERSGTSQPQSEGRATTPSRTQAPARQRQRAPSVEGASRISDASGCSAQVPARPVTAPGPLRGTSEPRRTVPTKQGRPLTPKGVRSATPQTMPSRPSQTVAVSTAFRVDQPKFPRETRQHKEFGQYWGPDHVPAEFLAALKESLKPCLDGLLLKSMFSEKMDELLKALQAWKRQTETQFSSMDEIMDLVLKWLTWVFFMTNTQVLKLALEVLGSILHGFEVDGRQMTDREAQILLPNLLERSGHNNSSIRDMMYSTLRQVPSIYACIRVLPFCVLSFVSKNKRTVAASIRFVGELLNGQVAGHLLRAPKDMDAILKLVTDKDAEVRKAAQQTAAILSQHMDSESFARVCERLADPAAKQAVRQASARLPSLAGASEESDMIDISLGSADQAGSRLSSGPAKTQQPAAAASTTRLASPRTRSVPSSPSRRNGGTSSNGAGTGKVSSRLTLQATGASPLRRPDSQGAKVRIAEPAARDLKSDDPPKIEHGAAATVSLTDLAAQLGECKREDFKVICDSIVSCVRRIGKEQLLRDTPVLAQALLDGMRAYFGAHSCVTRCWPLVDLLGEMCGLREFVRPLPENLLKGLLRELLKHLYNNSWTTKMDDGSQLLRKMNLACVMLLNSMSKPSACAMLLDLGLRESDVVGTSLVGKCLKKLNKNVSTSADAVESLLGVVYEFAQSARKYSASGAQGGDRDRVGQLMGHAREAVESVQQACPEVVSAWHRARLAEHLSEEDAEVLQDLLGNKENPTEGASPAPAKLLDASPVRRDSTASLDVRQALSPGPQQ